MALMTTYVQMTGQLSAFFNALREGQAPDKFTREYLKDLGFTSSNHHPLIPMLKGLGFLTSDGTPTPRYRDYLDKSQSRAVLASAVREAYSDIFTIKAKPAKSDRDIIEGKFRSALNISEKLAKLCANTFFALVELCDPDVLYGTKPAETKSAETKEQPAEKAKDIKRESTREGLSMHYNIQIHLPATKDIEVYNSIFKSLKEHLID
jgi:hypothetical protein